MLSLGLGHLRSSWTFHIICSFLLQPGGDEAGEVLELLLTRAVAHPGVRAEVHVLHAHGVQLGGGELAILVPQHLVRRAVCQEQRGVQGVRAQRRGVVVPERQIRAERRAPAQLHWATEHHREGHDATLAEPPDDDALRGHALRDGVVDEGGDVGGGGQGHLPVVHDALDGQVVDVVPPRHRHPPVERDGDGGRRGEDPLHALEWHLLRHVGPAVAGVAQAVQEDAHGSGLAPLRGVHHDGFGVRR
mmetsp:Transcript_25870/g.63677  ORF Transcript_25870/g.63677 Transcript_25870/m.63677 type:complete len:246 (+) Transcript_25870:59-796(+)